jgi:hypothetical protein
VVRGVVVGLGILVGLLAAPNALVAQQSASVLVRVNVIRAPIAPAAFDSLSQTIRKNESGVTLARAEARAAERGVRIRVVPAPIDRRDVLHMEYVAN